MYTRVSALAIAALLSFAILTPAAAAKLPVIKTSSSNQVPACATPGRLMAMLRSRNSAMDARYDNIAVDYMRHGEDLGLRWDYAFFQMLVETNNLKYTGDVDADQNNFAGLGATGNGVKGERFDSVSSGVRAHLEHILMYTGTHVDNPVAERTRKVQEWGILNKWRNSISGPLTFSHLGTKWAPGDRGYSKDISVIARIFYDGACNQPDPQPGLVAKARPQGTKKTKTVAVTTTTTQGTTSTTTTQPSTKNQKANVKDVAILNAPSKDAIGASDDGNAAQKQKTDKKSQPAATADKKNTAGCRVWTASYGGTKAVIIKAVSEGITNYTVLDVHAGKEKREMDAYIAAYAKGGKSVGEYPSQQTALNKAFELCPEG